MKLLYWSLGLGALFASCGGPKFRTCRTNADCLTHQECDVTTMLCVLAATGGGDGSTGGGDGSTGGGVGSTGGGVGSLNHWDVMTWDVGSWE